MCSRSPIARCLGASALALALAAAPAPARADEPLLLTLEIDGALPLSDPQASLFQPGVGGAVGLYRPITPWFLPGVRLRGLALFDGPAPADTGRVDPGVGGIGLLSVAARFRPLPGDAADPRRGTGLFVEVGGGLALTGDLLRGAAEGGVGWGFELGPVSLAPTVRYLWVHEPDDAQSLDPRDAHLLLAGVELVLLDRRAGPPPEPEIPDTDLDGILDPDDACPTVPEDLDGFEDGDGCPDLDNDGDSILDADDQCPNEPEDFDGFQDSDGCPDPDNDRDGILDADDQCPDEGEIVNGIEDDDGCPDQGLIQLVDDRIVLEERVLFEFERSRVRHSARAIILAIIELWRQHPEWREIRIEGHADVRGNAEFNQDLSERRAQNVMEALVRAGMPQEMIASRGFGAGRPRDLRDTEEAHQRNRRVEFVVHSRHDVVETLDVDDVMDGRSGAGCAGDCPEDDATDGDDAADGDDAPATDERPEPRRRPGAPARDAGDGSGDGEGAPPPTDDREQGAPLVAERGRGDRESER